MPKVTKHSARTKSYPSTVESKQLESIYKGLSEGLLNTSIDAPECKLAQPTRRSVRIRAKAYEREPDVMKAGEMFHPPILQKRSASAKEALIKKYQELSGDTTIKLFTAGNWSNFRQGRNDHRTPGGRFSVTRISDMEEFYGITDFEYCAIATIPPDAELGQIGNQQLSGSIILSHFIAIKDWKYVNCTDEQKLGVLMRHPAAYPLMKVSEDVCIQILRARPETIRFIPADEQCQFMHTIVIRKNPRLFQYCRDPSSNSEIEYFYLAVSAALDPTDYHPGLTNASKEFWRLCRDWEVNLDFLRDWPTQPKNF